MDPMKIALGEAGASDGGPLSGIRVLDLTSVISGPLCGQILGDLGADVIKVESLQGDTTRRLGPPFKPGGFTGFYTQFNRNKRALALDLKSDEGREVLLRLADDADVLLENWRPGVAERLGLGYAALAERNPRLLYVAINGFGPDGPYSELPAYDTVIQGLSGFMPTQGDATPALIRTFAADKVSAFTAAYAVLGALFARERGDGRGQRVDVPMLDSYVAFMMPDVVARETFRPVDDLPEMPNIHRTWETKDGHVVVLIVEDHQFRGMCQALDREDLADDERYANLVGRIVRIEELFGQLAEEIRKWPTDVLLERARRFGAPVAPVHSIEDMMSDPQVQHSEVLVDQEHPELGMLRYLRSPVRFEKTPAALRRHAPKLAEHTDEILREAGYDSEQIAALRERGTVS